LTKLLNIVKKRRIKMRNLQKMGGVAALYEALAYVVAMVGYLFVVDYPSAVEPLQKVALLANHQAFLGILNLFVYIVFSIFLVVLALALYERLKAGSPAIMQTATAIALIWACVLIAHGMIANFGMDTVVDLYGQDPAQAATVWLAIDSVVEGLGGQAGEILGGLWTLLVSWAALRAGGLPRALNYLGVVIGVAGILSAVPALGELGIGFIFGLGQIPWFAWLGIVMLRSSPSAAA
jgi:hypothetical protein